MERGWSEVGKEALRVLEELETEPGKNLFYLYTNVAYECFTKNKGVLALSVSLP
jgi:hypothetical protein